MKHTYLRRILTRSSLGRVKIDLSLGDGGGVVGFTPILDRDAWFRRLETRLALSLMRSAIACKHTMNILRALLEGGRVQGSQGLC